MFRRIFILSVGLMLVLGLVGTDVQAQGRNLVLRIDVHGPPDFVGPGTRGGRAFWVAGDICEEKEGPNCTDAGDFHCWGFNPQPPGPSLVSQLFIIDGGTISVQGPEAFGENFVPRAVNGGTGQFRNARGEMTSAGFDANGFLVVTFKLIGAGK